MIKTTIDQFSYVVQPAIVVLSFIHLIANISVQSEICGLVMATAMRKFYIAFCPLADWTFLSFSISLSLSLIFSIKGLFPYRWILRYDKTFTKQAKFVQYGIITANASARTWSRHIEWRIMQTTMHSNVWFEFFSCSASDYAHSLS